ncbi:MAG: 5-formyltetrahydrofolate cyclo-ligase [Flavobacteriaceae bacterium]
MLKKELRLNFTNLREKLSPEDLYSYNNSISKLVFQLPIWKLECYHIFLPIEKKKEVDTQSIVDLLRGLNKKIVVPKIKDAEELEHFLFETNTPLRENQLGIPEPQYGISVQVQQIDLVFVPLLIFDKKGHRVGYGKGYYDRFLKSCRNDVIKIGLSFFEPVESISDISNDDIALNYCVTPSEIYEF